MSGANNGRPDAPQTGATSGDVSGAAALALVRQHSRPTPYGAVNWAALADRVVADGGDELAARRQSAAWRPVGRRWWEVTAAWARPTIAAAVVVSAISAALALGAPLGSVADAGDGSGGAAQPRATGSWSALANRPASAVLDPAVEVPNRDSLYNAVVEQ
jgi:hypothetical protein